MAMDVAAQRLVMGDVVLLALPEEERRVEAEIVGEIARTDTSIRATLRLKDREDFVQEWPLGELVTVVRGP